MGQNNHSRQWGINRPPSKTLPSFLQAPLKPTNCPSPPFLGNPPSILVFQDPPSKSRIFQPTPKILKFFVLNIILSFKSN